MAKFVILLCFAAVVSSSFALECYQCDRGDCEKSQDMWRKQSCGQVGTPACLKHVYTDSSNKEMTVRRCIIAKEVNGVATHNCDVSVGAQKSCDICTSTLCNSAPVFYSQYALVAAVLSYLIPKYLL